MKDFLQALLVFVLAIVLSTAILAQPRSEKRGMGYGYHSAEDMDTVSTGCSWWYNWNTWPEGTAQGNYQSLGMDFCPMIWSDNPGSYGAANDYYDMHGGEYILGFNEPNFSSQANMTPQEAADAWWQIENLANTYGLKIVSPAMNDCGDCVSDGNQTYYSGVDWLDEFFNLCPDCDVDYIAVHWYGGGNSLEWYVDQYRKYNKPIWVTEFAAWDDPGINLQSQKEYMVYQLDWMENDPDIFRYAWFVGRTGGGPNAYPYIDILDGNGETTELGEIYLKMPAHDSDYVFTNIIPGRLETEYYCDGYGMRVQLTEDTDGFLNLGYTDQWDWVSYNIDVPADGTYTLTFRLAGDDTGAFDISVDDLSKGILNTNNTGGWQNWQEQTFDLDLTAGVHKLQFTVTDPGFNINWVEFSTTTDLCPSDPEKIAPGECGCGIADTDSDSDGTADCNDDCPNDPDKTEPGECGCGNTETSCEDCNGEPNGTAAVDDCDVCSGGNTGVAVNDCVLSIDEINSDDFDVFPNPSSGLFTIQNIDVHSWVIFNVIGKEIATGSGNEVLLAVDPGTYFLLVNNHFMKRLIVE